MNLTPTLRSRAVRALAVRLAIARNSAGGAAEAARLRRAMIEENVSLLWKVAGRFASRYLSVGEAVSVGYEGLTNAVDAYDPYREPAVAFATLAYLAIRRKIIQGLKVRARLAPPAARRMAAVRISDPGPAPADQLLRAERRAAVESLLAQLGGTRARTVRLRFGLDEAGPRSHAEVGRSLGKTTAAARQQVTQAIAELREIIAADPRWRDRCAC